MGQPINTSFSNLNKYIEDNGAELVITSMVAKTGRTVKLPAFITDIAQSFSSNWNTEDVFGRMDQIATFQSTNRTISIGLDIPAGTLKDAKNNLKACAKIASFLYPGYDEVGYNTTVSGATKFVKTAAVISKAPLVKIKYGNLIRSMKTGKGLLGFIESYDFSPVLEAGQFIAGKGQFYPKVISISLSCLVGSQLENSCFKEDFEVESEPKMFPTWEKSD